MKSQFNKHPIQYRYNYDSIGNALGNAAVAKIASYSTTEAKKEVGQKSYEKAKGQGKSDKEATAIAVKEMQAATSSANDASSQKQEAEATATRNGAISINGNENGGLAFDNNLQVTNAAGEVFNGNLDTIESSADVNLMLDYVADHLGNGVGAEIGLGFAERRLAGSLNSHISYQEGITTGLHNSRIGRERREAMFNRFDLSNPDVRRAVAMNFAMKGAHELQLEALDYVSYALTPALVGGSVLHGGRLALSGVKSITSGSSVRGSLKLASGLTIGNEGVNLGQRYLNGNYTPISDTYRTSKEIYSAANDVKDIRFSVALENERHDFEIKAFSGTDLSGVSGKFKYIEKFLGKGLGKIGGKGNVSYRFVRDHQAGAFNSGFIGELDFAKPLTLAVPSGKVEASYGMRFNLTGNGYERESLNVKHKFTSFGGWVPSIALEFRF